MAKFFVAGCFADHIVIDRDKDSIEKREGGPAYFIKNALEELGEEYELAKSKRGIVEIHIEGGREKGRFPLACKITHAPVKSDVVLAYSVSNELCLDKLKGDFSEIYVDSRGFVCDPENFGGKKNWCLKNFEKVRVLKTTPLEMQYVPEGLLSHVRKNGVLVVFKEDGKISAVEGGNEYEYFLEDPSACESIGARETFFAAFSSEYHKTRDCGKAMEFAVDYCRGFLKKKSEKQEKEAGEESSPG
ncbi:hypothetical protein GF412_02120 [Candidatus Micrarchaeota archaeon]|nr:hypothetical protein [Candidatus Micrarchaeota archaeon]MBD3417758.1 hypothetical protein [Candidatus Micrarchaeota archaeon]